MLEKSQFIEDILCHQKKDILGGAVNPKAKWAEFLWRVNATGPKPI